MPDTNKLLTLKNAGYQSSKRWLVRDINFGLCPGEILTLVGPNGAGKTTTVKLALNILQPSEGSVIRSPDLAASYVPQKLHLDQSLPMQVGRFMQFTRKTNRQSVNDALELTGASKLVERQLHELSGGELQRVQLARAIASAPQLLVLDEPAQGVDYTGEAELYKLITKIRDKTRCAILMVSHDLNVVMASTDRVICLNGHVCCSGAPQTVANSPEFQQLFGRPPSSALAMYHHDHDHTHLPDGRVKHADGRVSNPNEDDHDHHHGHNHSAESDVDAR